MSEIIIRSPPTCHTTDIHACIFSPIQVMECDGYKWYTVSSVDNGKLCCSICGKIKEEENEETVLENSTLHGISEEILSADGKVKWYQYTIPNDGKTITNADPFMVEIHRYESSDTIKNKMTILLKKYEDIKDKENE